MPITCRNRHCPKCQGAVARDWLAAREADLLPVGYFHLVFTLPAEIAPIAYQNKPVQWGILRLQAGVVDFAGVERRLLCGCPAEQRHQMMLIRGALGAAHGAMAKFRPD
jgi:hypothetical protein